MHIHLVQLAVGTLPVVLFLLGLVSLDSYKLVRVRSVLSLLAVGVAAAAVALILNHALGAWPGWRPRMYSRYGAPWIEETLKVLGVMALIRSQRVGFIVDAAIAGFAIGTGFALVENVYYLTQHADMGVAVWIVRGCGTAVLHGGTTALFAIISKSVADRRSDRGWWGFLPGWLAAIVLHSFFNHFFVSPVASTLLILIVLPVVIVLVFSRSEASLRGWLGVGFDADTELLELIESGRLSESRVGVYLQSLRESFRGEVVADMLCYLRLHTELSLRAKGELMMREAGFRTQVEPETVEKLEEMRYLEGSIGATGRLAMLPFLHVSGKQLWQTYMLRDR